MTGTLPTAGRSRRVPAPTRRPTSGPQDRRAAGSAGLRRVVGDEAVRPDGRRHAAAAADQFVRTQQARQWYDWIYRRVNENVPYDKIVEGLVLASGRDEPGESYTRLLPRDGPYYCGTSKPADFAARETMPLYLGAAKRAASRTKRRWASLTRSSACGCNAPSATSIRSTSGRSRISTSSRRSSAASIIGIHARPPARSARRCSTEHRAWIPRSKRPRTADRVGAKQTSRAGSRAGSSFPASWPRSVRRRPPKAGEEQARQEEGAMAKQRPRAEAGRHAELLGGETVDLARVD